jgi:hypothetical protein
MKKFQSLYKLPPTQKLTISKKMSNLVFVRLRPLQSGEKEACHSDVAPGASKLSCKLSSIDAKAEEFEFDQVLSSSCSQDDIFDVRRVSIVFDATFNTEYEAKYALTFLLLYFCRASSTSFKTF